MNLLHFFVLVAAIMASFVAGTENDCPANKERTIFQNILSDDYDKIDHEPMVFQNSMRVLKDRGAHRCWHKHSNFLQHLTGVHNLLRLWGESSNVGRLGLFHSAYANSYVNLALFDPDTERDYMKRLIGEDAEAMVYLFCIIDRQQIVVNTLLKQGYIPPDGITVPHLKKSGETVFLSKEILRILLVFSMADTADQHFGWQDQLFGGGENGSMLVPDMDITEQHDRHALWPGISKPGLWMSYASALAQVVRTFKYGNSVPPMFRNATERLFVKDEAMARDLYWQVISGEVTEAKEVIATLIEASRYNPWTFEPHVLRTQAYLYLGEYDAAIESSQHAMQLQQEWGTPWDKRLQFTAWVAWTRVLYERAKDRKPWPSNSWDIVNFGLVRME
jgi:hypothetical protein